MTPLGKLGADLELPMFGGLWGLPDLICTCLPPNPSVPGRESILPGKEQEESDRLVCLDRMGGECKNGGGLLLSVSTLKALEGEVLDALVVNIPVVTVLTSLL